METAIFLKEALPEKGSYCVFASNSSADRRSQQFFDSIDDLIDAAQDFDTKGYDRDWETQYDPFSGSAS